MIANTPGNPLEIYSNQDGKLYLDWIRFLKITLGLSEIEKLEMHGPAFVAFNHIGKRNGNVVMCFDCPMWHALARKEFHLHKYIDQNC